MSEKTHALATAPHVYAANEGVGQSVSLEVRRVIFTAGISAWPQIRKMLRCIDSKSSIGARDRAQFPLMSAYGLGGAEVLQLQLTDIDWAAR